MPPDSTDKIRTAERGAVLVEAAIFFLFTILLFFVTINFALWLREKYVVTEAARHGGRSLAASSVRLGTCPDIFLPTGVVSCSGLSSAAPISGSVANVMTAVWSTCEYLQKAGYNPDDFSVSASAFSDLLDSNTAKMTPNKVWDVEVMAIRSRGGACIFCSLFSLGRTAQVVRFPLNPYIITDPIRGLQRC